MDKTAGVKGFAVPLDRAISVRAGCPAGSKVNQDNFLLVRGMVENTVIKMFPFVVYNLQPRPARYYIDFYSTMIISKYEFGIDVVIKSNLPPVWNATQHKNRSSQFWRPSPSRLPLLHTGEIIRAQRCDDWLKSVIHPFSGVPKSISLQDNISPHVKSVNQHAL
ncbi:hypothetical protein TNIN_205301 [Trichonephila inaurata madagascariensis]|uniref:Uncharacterized protein n=1 Tax=Trichonephila inaurata madagascariensis TaxID=2747483 RepID=A0A8X6XFT1_9ARAC|nr:hypothetical protein TNIN_205301 [Trichonephila inaurata madagascariensis]